MRIKTFTLLTLALFVMSVVAIAQKPSLKQSALPQVPEGLQLQRTGQKKVNKSAFKLPNLNLSQGTQKGKTITWGKNVKPIAKKKASNRVASSNEYTYGFAQAFNGWTTIDADGDGYTWYVLTANESTDIFGHDGEPGLATSASYASTALTPDNYLVSPKMKLDGSLTFYANAQDASWAAEHFGVAVSTASATDPADFTMVQTWDMTAAPELATPVANAPAGAFRSARRVQGNWYQYEVDLSGYAGAEGYVAIRHFDCTDMFRLNVDDITLTTSELLADYDPDLEQQPESGLVTPPDGLETTEWSLSCFEVQFDGDTGEPSYTEFTSTVNVVIDAANGEVYVQGLCPYVPEGWIMGTLSSSGTEVTFPTGQYFGTYEDEYDFYFLGVDEDFYTDDVVMDIDVANGVMTMKSPAYVLLYYISSSGEGYFILTGLTFSQIPDVAATPAQPTIIGVGSNWGYPYLAFDVPTTDEEGNPIQTSKLSYMFYVDVDQEVSPLTLTTDLYSNLEEDMMEIPYGFTDNYDIYDGTLYLNMDFSTWRRIGIQSIYTGGGEERRSEISWFAMYSYNVSVPAQGYATFYIDEPVMVAADAAEAGAEMLGVTAVADEAVTVTPLDAADGNTPLLIYNGSDEKMTVSIVPTDAPGLEMAFAPEYKGTLVDKTFSDAEMEQANHYGISGSYFVWVRDAGTIGANKCWLEIDNGVNAEAPAMLKIVRNGDATGISTVERVNLNNESLYDLQGRRLTGTPSKAGIYIQNGKKFVIK